MARRVYFTGLKRVQANLTKEIRKIKGRTKQGLWIAAENIRREAQILTPVATGNLKGSAYVNAYNTPVGPGAEIGFTASYAVFVHEIQASHKGKGQWKFLETAMKKLARKTLATIRRHAKV